MSSYEHTLGEWIEMIENEVMFVNVKPYSHNMISAALGAIADRWGNAEANRVIDELELEHLGWKKVV